MTRNVTRALLLATLFVAGNLGWTGAALADPEDLYYRAYYLQHEAGDLEQALKLYEKVADSSKVDKAMAASAALQARCCREDLRSRNFARLMPPKALAYVELRAPGEHVIRLLEQLGLVGNNSWKLPENVKQEMQKFALSPALLKEFKSFYGVAVAVTGFDPVKQMPAFVAVLHPGDNDLLRGAIETALPAAAEQQSPVRGTHLFKIEGMYVALTPRLVIVSPMRTEVDAALKRLAEDDVASLANDKEFAALHGGREDRMIFASFNAKAAMPLIQSMSQVAGAASQEFQIASALLDLDSLRWIAMRAGVAEDGLYETLLVRFDEDQNNLVYNFMRTPPLTGSSLRCVPHGAAAFMAMALSEATGESAGRKMDKAETVRRITGLDLGREFFANIEEKVLYLLPPAEDTPPAESDFVMPDVGLALTVRDPSRSAALWTQLLSLPTLATGKPTPEGKPIKIGDAKVTAYEWPEGIKAYFANVDNHILITFTKYAMTKSLKAARGGKSVLDDEAFKPTLERLGDHSCKALFVHAGRCVHVGRRVSGEDLDELAQFEPLMEKLVASVVTDESNSEFRLSAALTGIPEIGGLVEELVMSRTHGCSNTCHKKVEAKPHSGHGAKEAQAAAINKQIEAEVKAAIREAKAQAKAAKAQARAAQAQARAQAKKQQRDSDKPEQPAPPEPPAPPKVQAPAPPTEVYEPSSTRIDLGLLGALIPMLM